MTDKTKLIKTKNNLLEFIEDKTKDIFMLLKTEKQINYFVSRSLFLKDCIKKAIEQNLPSLQECAFKSLLT